MHIVVIVQARCNSTRIPYKVVKSFCAEMTPLEHVLRRCGKITNVNQIIVNTTTNYSDNKIVNVLEQKNLLNDITIYRGSENNVLDRTYQAARITRADIIICVNATSVFIDHRIVDIVYNFFIQGKYNYVSLGADAKVFPNGMDFEIFDMDTLQKTWREANDPYDLEHVTSFIRNDKARFHQYEFNLMNINDYTQTTDATSPSYFSFADYPNIDFENLNLAIQDQADWDFIKRLYTSLYNNNDDFTIQNALYFLNQNSHIITYKKDRKNIDFDQNTYHGKAQKLITTAMEIIPQGCQTIEKSPNTYLPELFPAYYVGCGDIEITTLDGVKFKDFSTMNMGANILGYRDPDVDAAVHACVEKGNSCSLNSPAEVKLIKKFLELHQWASIGKIVSSESDAFSLAVKMARTMTGKHTVIMTGFCGWHDTFQSVNFKTNLTNQTTGIDQKYIPDPSYVKLKDLPLNGVNPALAGSAILIDPHNIDEIIQTIEKNNKTVGCLIMQPSFEIGTQPSKIEKLMETMKKYNIILIFDETRTAFRSTLGGSHLKYENFIPDIAVFGRTISNGYPVAVVLGNSTTKVSAHKLFASDLSWSNDIGICAALETINKCRELDVHKHVRSVARYFRTIVKGITESENLNIKIKMSGDDTRIVFEFDYNVEDYYEFGNGKKHIYGNLNNTLRTLYTQMMLERRIIASNVFYPSYAHTFERVKYYTNHMQEVLKEISHLLEVKKIHAKLLTEPAQKSYLKL